MAYTLDINLALGAANTGLTLEAQLIDSTGANVGTAITTGFFEVGGGNYLWHYAAWPDGHRGGVKFNISPAGAIKAFVGINPQEEENADVKTSSVAAAVWAVSVRTLTSFGTLAADTATAVWASGTRTLTAFSQAFSDQTWSSAVRTLSAFSQAFSDQVWTTAVRTLTSFGTLVADTATAVWSYPSRTLTSGSAAPPLVIADGNFEFLRGDSISISITGLPSLVGRTKLWFTVKDNVDNADASALIQIQEGVGLVVLNGAPGTAGQGSLVVTNAGAGNVTITLAAVASAALARNVAGTYDIQMLVGTTVTTLAMGTFTMTADITRAVS